MCNNSILKSKVIASLRKAAQSCINKANKININISGNWTYRRQRFADNAQHKKDNLIKNASLLNKLADLWEANLCPGILQKIRNVTDLSVYYPTSPDINCPIDGWYRKEYPIKLNRALKLGIKSKTDEKLFNDTLSDLLRVAEITISPKEQTERNLKEALKKVHSMHIPGFFPTPDTIIDVLLDLSNITP